MFSFLETVFFTWVRILCIHASIKTMIMTYGFGVLVLKGVVHTVNNLHRTTFVSTRRAFRLVDYHWNGEQKRNKLWWRNMSVNKLGYFYVTAWSIVEKGYNKNFAARFLEKWLRYWQWPTKLAIEAPIESLKFYVVLTLLFPTERES